MADLIVNGLNISMLSDDELFRRLKQLGLSCGPIVESTRSVYQRKLARILCNEEIQYDEADEYEEEESIDTSRHTARWGDELRRRPLNRNIRLQYSPISPISHQSRRLDAINRVVDQERPRQAVGKSALSLKVKFAIMAVGILIILLIYQNMECSINSPIPAN